jgi:predicted small secreted protein
MKKVDWNEMVFVLLIIAMLLFSCTTSRCGNWKDVQRHDRKPFRASINSGSSSNPNIIRANKN